VQDDIASDISGQLRLKLTGDEKKQLLGHTTENSEAYQLYVKGRYSLEQRTRESSTMPLISLTKPSPTIQTTHRHSPDLLMHTYFSLIAE